MADRSSSKPPDSAEWQAIREETARIGKWTKPGSNELTALTDALNALCATALRYQSTRQEIDAAEGKPGLPDLQRELYRLSGELKDGNDRVSDAIDRLKRAYERQRVSPMTFEENKPKNRLNPRLDKLRGELDALVHKLGLDQQSVGLPTPEVAPPEEQGKGPPPFGPGDLPPIFRDGLPSGPPPPDAALELYVFVTAVETVWDRQASRSRIVLVLEAIDQIWFELVWAALANSPNTKVAADTATLEGLLEHYDYAPFARFQAELSDKERAACHDVHLLYHLVTLDRSLPAPVYSLELTLPEQMPPDSELPDPLIGPGLWLGLRLGPGRALPGPPDAYVPGMAVIAVPSGDEGEVLQERPLVDVASAPRAQRALLWALNFPQRRSSAEP
ncbi:hypothetical protein SAMN06265365_102411 [Tistlia consotensis]|uniref:Uncharacterized protein n=1 Tax=Tistlia consotensis USBA 355 TaxID=560819 RepID=A0A1Y6C022_9PROT|nr:hypothetical protein [Tistlia consotensis]SMF38637.1 hypothetical protein SAMN05428998_11352 [Tistlia consotensis USBA 355]SNR36964.1 hypothetical protein SAMN06265365_102411 [Tistlia consotensis]